MFSFLIRNKKIIFIAGVVILMSALVLFAEQEVHQVPFAFRIGDNTITLEIVKTEYARMQGLSGRTSIKENTGMLFVFEEPGRYPFWMRDMHFSIDIIWLDNQFKVIHVEREVAPETYPELFAPTQDALYVLEIREGVAEELGIVEGTLLDPVYSSQRQEA